MAKTLLDATNEILKKVGVIAGDAGLLTTLTDSARQVSVDLAIQVVNEGIDELYTTAEIAMPNEQNEGAITLTLGTNAYALAAALVQIRWPMIDRTNSQFIFEYPGGYNAMLIADPEVDDTGLPHFGTIRPTDSQLFLDRRPTAADVGRVYYYQYDKTLELTIAGSSVPFNDTVFRAMVPVWAQLWRRARRGDFDEPVFRMSIGRASRLLTQKQMRTHYCPR